MPNRSRQFASLACQRRARRGTATVELALCLPVIIVLVMGAIECTSMIFVEQSLHVVAYETIRAAIKGTATNEGVQSRADQVILERKLHGARIQLLPADIEDLEPGERITVIVTAPTSPNSAMPLHFFSADLRAVAVMNKE